MNPGSAKLYAEKLLENRKLLAITSILLIGAAAATANTLVTGNTQPDGYALNVTTMSPTAVKPTEAEFRANVTNISSIYDAALVYWNYTNTNTGETYRSVYTLTLNESTVSTFQPGLKAGTNYNVKAYVQPVIWEDQKLMSNMVDEEGAMSEVASSSTAMNAIAGVQEAETALANAGKVVADRPVLINQYSVGSDDYVEIVATENNVDVSNYAVQGTQITTGDVFSGTLDRGEVQGASESDGSGFESGISGGDTGTIELVDGSGNVVDTLTIKGDIVTYRNSNVYVDGKGKIATASTSPFNRNQLNPGQR